MPQNTEEVTAEAKVEKKVGTHKQETWDWIKSLISALVIALLIREFVIQAFTIPTGSMESTMLVGDHLFVNKLSYGFKLPFTTKKIMNWGRVKRDSIVVFLPPHEADRVYVKRCKGLPGDKMEIKDKALFVNGVISEDLYKKHIDINIYPGSTTARDNLKTFTIPKNGDVLEIKKDEIYFSGQKVLDMNIARLYALLAAREGNIAERKKDGYYSDGQKLEDFTFQQICAEILGKNGGKESFEHKVKENYYFMMGDNRDNSADSRFWGFVPRERLIGRPVLVWMPLDRFGLPPK
ncbi:MAG: signal peptidase I [Candidatus Firestonebacteria bacterium]